VRFITAFVDKGAVLRSKDDKLGHDGPLNGKIIEVNAGVSSKPCLITGG
jgi:hypothetical protein